MRDLVARISVARKIQAYTSKVSTGGVGVVLASDRSHTDTSVHAVGPQVTAEELAQQDAERLGANS